MSETTCLRCGKVAHPDNIMCLNCGVETSEAVADLAEVARLFALISTWAAAYDDIQGPMPFGDQSGFRSRMAAYERAVTALRKEGEWIEDKLRKEANRAKG